MTKSKGPQGLSAGKLAACAATPNNVCSEDGAPSGKSVAPLATGDISAISDAIKSMGGVVTATQPSYLASEFTSKIFKFVDDLEVRVDGDIAHVRSASRVGYSDRGINRKRVEALRARLK